MLGVLVHLPFLPQRAVCPPVLARLWRPKHPDRTKNAAGLRAGHLVAERYPDRSLVRPGREARARPRQAPRPRPWYTTKQAVSVADMLAAFRRALIAGGYRAGQPLQPTSTEILEIQAA